MNIEEIRKRHEAGFEGDVIQCVVSCHKDRGELLKRVEELESTIQRISKVPDRCRPCNTWEYNMKAAQKPITIPKCVCVKCQYEQFPRLYYMAICPECGDKRCDKAANHDNECQAIKGEG